MGMKWTTAMSILLLLVACSARANVKINTVTYSHASVGTTGTAAIAPASVVTKVYGWSVCHDAGSANAYLAVSKTADPDLDGVRVGPGECYHCTNCGSRSLKAIFVKGSAAATGYSIVQNEQ
jgi:hypothetical protein